MSQLISRLFNINRGERRQVLFLFIIATLTNAGAIWGLTIVYAAFLQQVGISALPMVLVLGALASIAAIAVYTAFVDRIADGPLLIYILLIEAVGIIFGLILLALNQPSIAYPFLYLLILSLVAVINPHQITYFNSFYDTQSAKRILPLVTAGYRLGGIVAGLSIPLLNTWLNPGGVILFWLAGHLLVMAVVFAMPRLISQPAITLSTSKESASYLENIKEGFQFTSQSIFLRWLALGTFLMMALMAFLEYQAGDLLSASFDNTADLADYLGILVGVGNLIVLPLLLFGMSRIIAYIGLSNASLIFPLLTAGVSGTLMALPGLVSASLAHLNRTAFRLAFHTPIDGLLYNAVPLRVKGRARAFVNGLIIPIGSLVGGLLLLLPFISSAWFVPALIGLFAAAYLICAWFIRRQYSQALIKMLEDEDFSFLFGLESVEFAVTDPATLANLEQRLTESDDPEFTIFMAQLISQIGGNNAIPILDRAVRNAESAYLKAALLEIITAADLRGEAISALYMAQLADEDGPVRQAALAGLEQFYSPQSEIFQFIASEALADPNLEVRVQVLSALIRGGNYAKTETATLTLYRMLQSKDPHEQARGVYILGQMQDESALQQLFQYLNHPGDEVRLEAILALETLPNDLMLTERNKPRLVKEMRLCLDDPVERIRQGALIILGRLASRESHQVMAQALTDNSVAVRSAAVTALVQVGKGVIPALHPLLDSADLEVRKMVAVVLSQINPREYGPLISTHITDNLLTIYRQHSYLQALKPYAEYAGIAVLQDTLREENKALQNEIFYLLSAQHNPSAVALIAESLYSADKRIQANAIEALEALTSPQTTRLIAPLAHPQENAEQIARLGQETWDIPTLSGEEILRQLADTNTKPWLRTVTIFTLGEIGLAAKTYQANQNDIPAQIPASSEAVEEPKAPRSRRRRGTVNLFSALEDSASNESEAQPPKRSRRRPPNPLSTLLGDDSLPDDDTAQTETPPVAQNGSAYPAMPFKNPSDLEALIANAVTDPNEMIRRAGISAQRTLAGVTLIETRMAAYKANRLLQGLQTAPAINEEEFMLSDIEKIIFLKKVPFFQGMTIEQLKSLATVCEETLFPADTRIFEQGDLGGTLYVVVSGKVAIEQEGRRKGSVARLATLGPYTYFGEMNLFDNSPRAAAAITTQDTLTLKIRREPLVALARQNPDLSLELINVLSQRLREANEQIAGLTRAKPTALHKLYDSLE